MTIRTEAMSLRLAGLSYAEIGKRLGISRQRAQQLTCPPRVVRLHVASEAGDACQGCGLELPNGGGHVHHLGILNAEEDYNDLPNLRYLCASCHRNAHADLNPPPPLVQRLNLRIPDPLDEALRAEHARTYPEHGMKLSPWLMAIWSEHLREREEEKTK